MMNGSMGTWYSGMHSGGWMGVLILAVVIVVLAVVYSRKK